MERRITAGADNTYAEDTAAAPEAGYACFRNAAQFHRRKQRKPQSVSNRLQTAIFGKKELLVGDRKMMHDFYGFELFDFLAAGDVLSAGDYDVSGLADANHNLDKLQIALRVAERI